MIDPKDTDGLSRKQAEKKLEKSLKQLSELQEVLYAQAKHRVLIVLQAMDTGGKDGTIRDVAGAFNPLGVKVTAFKKPSKEEAAHHFLWRIRNALPERPGMIGVFNRSHYEDILVPSVFHTFPKSEIESRYREIVAFENDLVRDGWLVLKFFLHISKGEQKERLQARLDDPTKAWKWDSKDLEMRKLWPKFQDVYGRILERTNTEAAPWHVVPSDNKWYRNYEVARIIKKQMKKLDLEYPPPPPGLDKIKIPD
jgi:PPK2 family polyphosphate:nucleotide phosphotransferase